MTKNLQIVNKMKYEHKKKFWLSKTYCHGFKSWRPTKSANFSQTMIIGINNLTFFFSLSTMQTLQKLFYNKCTKMITWFYNRCTKLVTWSSKCLIPLSFHHPHFYWFQIYSLCSSTNSPKQANMAYCKKKTKGD